MVSQLDTQKTSRTSQPHGIAWWVNKRLVGEPSWRDFEDDQILDRRTKKARRYTFVVQADVLVGEVEEDWSDFKHTDKFRTVHSAVRKHIRQRLINSMKDVHKTQKKVVLHQNEKNLINLPSESQYYISRTIDGIQQTVPRIEDKVLSATVKVLSNLEKSRSGYDLLEQLANLKPDELDDLNEILNNWSVHDAQVVLGELDRRLKLIEQLERFVDDPTSDELHTIHPLFERGLWIFGTEYESVHFRSNKALSTVIRDLFKDNSEVPLQNPRRRPDLVVLPDSTVGDLCE